MVDVIPGGSPAGPVIPQDQQKVQEQLTQLQEANKTLTQERDGLKKQVGENASKLEGLHKTIISPEYLAYLEDSKKGIKDPGDKGGKEKPQAIDLNQLDNVELANFIVGEIKKVVTDQNKPIEAKVTAIDAKTKVAEAAGRFKDFWDYKDAMIEIAGRMPGLDPAEIYVMVKGMEAVSSKSFKTAKQDASGEATPAGESGSRPTSGETGSGPSGDLGSGKARQPESYGDAAGMAYDKIFGKK